MFLSRHYPRKKNNGFSLIEIVVVGGLVSIVMVGVITMFSSLTRSQKSVGQSTDFENLIILLRMALQNPVTCPTAFQNAVGLPVPLPTSLTVAAPNLPASGIQIDKISIGTLLVDTAVPYNGLYIQSIQLNQVVVGNPSATTPVPYTAALRITGSKTKPGVRVAVGGGVLLRDIPISLTIQLPAGSGPPTIVSCSTSTSSNPSSAAVFGWISSEPGATQLATHIRYTDGSDHSPLQMCIRAGYSSYSGACEATFSDGKRINGSIVSNQTTYFPNWAISCLYGNGAAFFSAASGKILCVK